MPPRARRKAASASSATLTTIEAAIPVLATTAHIRAIDACRIAQTCVALRATAAREDIWKDLLLIKFRSCASLPAAAFNVAAGRGYRWFYRQRMRPDASERPPPVPPLPEPVLKRSDLVLLVEIASEDVTYVSRMIDGEDRDTFLKQGYLTLDISDKDLALQIETRLQLNRSHFSPNNWVLDGTFSCEDAGVEDLLGDVTCKVQLLRLTDYKVITLIGPESFTEEFSGFHENRIDGDAWDQGEPEIEPGGARKFKALRKKALEEDRRSLMFVEVCGERLHWESLHGVVGEHRTRHEALRAHLLSRGVNKPLECHIRPIFALPKEPREFVYDQMAAASRADRSAKLGQLFHRLDDDLKAKALSEADCDPNERHVPVGMAGRPLVALNEVVHSLPLMEFDVTIWYDQGDEDNGYQQQTFPWRNIADEEENEDGDLDLTEKLLRLSFECMQWQ